MDHTYTHCRLMGLWDHSGLDHEGCRAVMYLCTYGEGEAVEKQLIPMHWTVNRNRAVNMMPEITAWSRAKG